MTKPIFHMPHMHAARIVAALIAASFLSACAQTASTINLAGAATGGSAKSSGFLLKRTKKPVTPVSEPSGGSLMLARWASAFARSPKNEHYAIGYARALKAAGKKKKALSVLVRAAMANPGSKAIASESGRVALALGQAQTALKFLKRAYDPARPDWRVLSAQGAALARLGKHNDARKYFERALVLKPGHPSLLNNLAMAHALSGDPKRAESLLRRAIAAGSTSSKTRQNLALVLGLQRKYGEARKIAALDNAAAAAADVSYLKHMVGRGTAYGGALAIPPATAPAPTPLAAPKVIASKTALPLLRGTSKPAGTATGWATKVATK